MIRPLLSEIGLFLLPFAAYALFLVVSRTNVLTAAAWPLHVIGVLIGVASLLTIGALTMLANFSGAPPHSTYTPAHMENGRLVPGVDK
jgi:Family of unknown function (DUF6111)